MVFAETKNFQNCTENTRGKQAFDYYKRVIFIQVLLAMLKMICFWYVTYVMDNWVVGFLSVNITNR